MITCLQERHRPLFASLSDAEVMLVWHRVTMRWDTCRPPPPVNANELFEMCQAAGLDHARVVLSLADMNGAARPILEKLIGKPIAPWAEAVTTAQGAAVAGIDRGAGAAPARAAKPLAIVPSPVKVADNRRVLAVKPNPYRLDTTVAITYLKWRVGDTVDQCKARGLTAQSVRRDVRRGYVTLEEVSNNA